MIDRPHYLDKLIAKKENGLIKIITGNKKPNMLIFHRNNWKQTLWKVIPSVYYLPSVLNKEWCKERTDN